MVKTYRITDFIDFIKKVEVNTDYVEPVKLYRGQNVDKPLLPSIARDDNLINTTKIEKKMLNELKRRSFNIIDNTKLKDDWDWLVYAQHFGLETRLLDWTSNPLVALFFACADYADSDAFVYVLRASKLMTLRRTDDKTPYTISGTRILRPPQNNERLIAQAGWFTSHTYSESSKKFVSLETNSKMKNRIEKYIIPTELKEDFMIMLDKFGINYQTMFPDAEGLCDQINWEFE